MNFLKFTLVLVNNPALVSVIGERVTEALVSTASNTPVGFQCSTYRNLSLAKSCSVHDVGTSTTVESSGSSQSQC